jgi:hypothetical protein
MRVVVLPRADLPFPGSLPELQRLFPDDTAEAAMRPCPIAVYRHLPVAAQGDPSVAEDFCQSPI